MRRHVRIDGLEAGLVGELDHEHGDRVIPLEWAFAVSSAASTNSISYSSPFIYFALVVEALRWC